MALSGSNTFRIDFDMSDLNTYLDQLGEDAEKAIRPAAQAAIQVIYERVKLNVQALGRSTGNLDRSIYQYYSKEHSQDGLRAQYHVSWNAAKAPHGHLVEYGYLQRYRYYQDNQGRVRPMVRPGMEGQLRPGRHSSDAQKAAYFVMLDTPKQIPGKAFVRNASAALPDAYMAAENKVIEIILKKAAQ